MFSATEENYLKAIFKLAEKNPDNISTNEIAQEIQTTPASVSDMLKKLAEKQLIDYEKYKGVQLTDKGKETAVNLIRAHRLWEVFLLNKLGFTWDQVHEVAEELEHIKSPFLISRLEAFLDYPKYDPHGDPIPDATGNIDYHDEVRLSELHKNEKGIVVGVEEQSTEFLQYLDKINLSLNSEIEVLEFNDYDHSTVVRVGDKEMFVSEKVGKNLLVKKL